MSKLPRRSVLVSAGALSAAALLPAACTGSRASQRPPPHSSKKLLVLGGTGFLGPAIVASALERGHSVTLFNRGKTAPGRFTELEQLRGDRNGQLDALKDRKWDAVIDTSGYFPAQVRDSATLLGPNVGQYIFVSSISVYSDAKAPDFFDEHSEVQPLENPESRDIQKDYGALKAACERAAETAMPGRVTNVRPGLIVGPDDPTDRFTYWPVRATRGGEILAPGDGRDSIQFIDVRDLGLWLVVAAERNHVGVFNAVGPSSRLEMSTFLLRCQQVAGVDSKLTWVDSRFLEEQKVSPWSDLPAWIPRSSEGRGLTNIHNAAAVAKGLSFRTSMETLRDTLAWWNEQPEARRAKLDAGLSAERERAVLAAWAEKNPGSAKAS